MVVRSVRVVRAVRAGRSATLAVALTVGAALVTGSAAPLQAAALQAGLRRDGRQVAAERDDRLTAEQQRAFDAAMAHYRRRDEHYQQTTFAYLDPVGDAALYCKVARVPSKLLDAMVGRDYPQGDGQPAEAEAADPYGDLIFGGDGTTSSVAAPPSPAARPVVGRDVPLDVEAMLNAFHGVMARHYPAIVPTMGVTHRWTPAAKRYFESERGAPPLFQTKLFACLACGWTSRYMITGREEGLKAWILAQRDRSVMPHTLFEQSYVLCGGDVYLTLLTCENVLAGNPYRADRDKDEVQPKLAYIRPDSQPPGDNYGAWYHFFGIALYGAYRGPLEARLVARIESLGSLFLEPRDPQEDHINNLGARFGDLLERRVHGFGGAVPPLPSGAGTEYLLVRPRW